MIYFLLLVNFHIFHARHEDRNLFSHVVHIVLSLNIVSRMPEYASECIAYACVSEVSDVEWTVWICRCVLYYHTTFSVKTNTSKYFTQ